MLVQDTGRPFAANIPINGVSNLFDLPVESISATDTPMVILNGVVITNMATPAYVIDYKHGVIVFTTPPQPSGVILGVSGITYDFFDDDEVAQAVIDAFNLHVNDQDPLPVIDAVVGSSQTTLSSNEEYCVSILAAIELLWFRATDAAQEIDIHTPEGVDIPRSQRYHQILQQIQDLTDMYQSYAGALGIGLWRIQVLNQRRVSYTTNRLVPIYREQEYNTPYAGFVPTTGAPGSIITINGMYFSSTVSVTFGGVVATSFTVISDTEVQAVVPVGAMTGQIGVTTSYGTVLTTAQFVVGGSAPFVNYGVSQVKIPIPPGL
jgi:hypothetical protein